MKITIEELQLGTQIFNNIIENDLDIENELLLAVEKVNPKTKRQFLSHISTLFLNVMLNGFTEFGKYGETKSIEARKIIIKLMDN
jgi:hypothetical protein